MENTPSFYKGAAGGQINTVTHTLQNTSKRLKQSECNDGDDDIGVFEDFDLMPERAYMLTIDH